MLIFIVLILIFATILLFGFRSRISNLSWQQLGSDVARGITLYPVTLASQSDYKMHLYLRAIDNNTLISKLTPADAAGKDEYFQMTENREQHGNQAEDDR